MKMRGFTEAGPDPWSLTLEKRQLFRRVELRGCARLAWSLVDETYVAPSLHAGRRPATGRLAAFSAFDYPEIQNTSN